MASEPPARMPSLDELRAARDRLEKELQIIGQSFAQLKDAQERFAQNIATLTLLKSASDGQKMLVPITKSVYTEAIVDRPERVLVDIGTGYLMEKGLNAADEYYVRKVKYLQEKINMVGQVLYEKRQNLAVVSQALNQ